MTATFTSRHCYEMWERIKKDPKCRKSRCVYAEVLSEVIPAPYISICVEDPREGCRVGFRGAEPLRLTGYHVADLGSAVVKCGRAELRIEPINCVTGQSHITEPYSGPTDIAIRVWWDKCLRVMFDGKSYYICPRPAAQSQPQEMRRRLREIVRRLVERIHLYLSTRNVKDKADATAEGHNLSSQRDGTGEE